MHPIKNVEPPIKIRVSKKVYLRPTKSPRRPNTKAPNGRTIKPAAKVAKVDKKAAQMGSTSGGASQLLKTKLSFTSNIKETRYPAFSLKTGYQWRGSYIIGKK